MRNLNLDQLRALQAVTEGKSFSAAARKLNLSQPAVSVQIRELERRFGVKLVERLGKQAHATEPGKRLVEAAEDIFRACDRAEEAMRRFRDGWVGRVRLGSTLTAMIYRLPPVLRQLRLEHPGVELVHTNAPSRESVELILQNKLDLALVNLPVEQKRLKVTPLCRERMVAIFPPDGRDIPDVVTPAYAASQPILVEQLRSSAHALVLDWLAAPGLRPMAVGTAETLKTAVLSKLGIAIVADVAVARNQSEFVVRPLRPSLKRALALIEHRNKPNDPALQIVRAALLALRNAGTAAR